MFLPLFPLDFGTRKTREDFQSFPSVTNLFEIPTKKYRQLPIDIPNLFTKKDKLYQHQLMIKLEIETTHIAYTFSNTSISTIFYIILITHERS